MSHYYTDNKDLPSNRREFEYYFDDVVFRFTTDNGVFSKGKIDYGSYLLIESVYKLNLGKQVLDLGCGYGPVGIIIKHFNSEIEVDAVDVNSRALELTKLNSDINKVDIKTYLCEDILTLNHKYDSIILNPPIRTGKKVIYDLYERSRLMLNDGGHFYIVIQKKQGANSSISKLETLFNKVEVINKDGGYLVIDSYN
ncbi:MAG: class I SAM-dependent methyltransferase [Firmicutes bacterium]|nr:class I SAM-dependent methyltransferase [Candidatus Colivicinus equi]